MKYARLCVVFVIFFAFAAANARAERLIPADSIMRSIREAILAKTKYAPDSLVIDCQNPPQPEPVQDGTIDVQVRLPTRNRLIGFTPAEVVFVVDGKEVKRKTIYVQVDVKTKAFMTTRWIKRYEPLHAENITMVETLSSKVPMDAITTPEELINTVVKVAVPKGKFITHSLVEEPPLVKRQDIVDVVLQQSGLQITTKGVVLSDGRLGERVQVRNLESKRELSGRVKDARTVIVE